ncbi:MAG: methyltransferase [Spirochaetota bacterium]
MDASQTTRPEPKAVLNGIMNNHVRARLLFTAVNLGIPDILAGGARDSHELASHLGADQAALYRFLRALASMDVLEEVEPGRFGLSVLGDYVRTDHADAFHEVVRWNALEWELWSRFEQSVMNGKSAFENAYGLGIFDYLTEHSEYGRYFDRAMSEFVGANIASIVEAYTFAPGGSVVDVGGGSGALLTAILRANANLRGVVFDLPEAVESAATNLADPELSARCEFVGGSFFESVPSGADTYILSSILHDWDDDRCRVILRNVRSAMSDQSRLVISELLVPDGTAPSPIKVFDLNMLVFTSGGRERTRAEFASLLDAADFRLERVVSTQTAVSLLEAVPLEGRHRTDRR